MRGFTTILGDFTNIASAKTHFFQEGLHHHLRRAFDETMMTRLCQHVGMRGFANTFGVYTNIASAKHLVQEGLRKHHQ